jgi:hypothetical protein
MQMTPFLFLNFALLQPLSCRCREIPEPAQFVKEAIPTARLADTTVDGAAAKSYGLLRRPARKISRMFVYTLNVPAWPPNPTMPNNSDAPPSRF